MDPEGQCEFGQVELGFGVLGGGMVSTGLDPSGLGSLPWAGRGLLGRAEFL